ncbi:hypothetical protein QC763_0069050 [Podospora pseudopauciseta]|uniref:Uncharacterized protein n=1 Tax=Podospora pseudopauciseta TaxID=2093780 RepID=A0ABR0HDC9_9PEZI|nr:hypothetical protein QC763_0069050 [Podospora pseudopauciseta]
MFSTHILQPTETKPIRITAVNGYVTGLAARRLNFSVVPHAVGFGGYNNTITTSLAAILCKANQDSLDAQVATGTKIYLHVEWRYDTPFPKFNTTHLLVVGSSPSFALLDGSASAMNIANIANFAEAQETTPILSCPQWNPEWVVEQATQQPPFMSTTRNMIPEVSWDAFWLDGSSMSSSSLGASVTYAGASLPILPDDQLPACSDWASTASTVSEATTPSPSIDGSFGQCSSSLAHIDVDDYWMNSRIERQLQDPAFQMQKRQANELYSQIGDVSGLIAVMRAANKLCQGNHPHEVPELPDLSDFNRLSISDGPMTSDTT